MYDLVLYIALLSLFVQVLKLAENGLTELPYSIGKLGSLANLDVSRNRLSSLPPTIGSLKKLTRLDASHNELSALPSTIIKCKSLEEVLLANNPLGTKDLPHGLTLRCPNLYNIEVDENGRDEE
jgi:Leucine-rich repeat (LRR) protein